MRPATCPISARPRFSRPPHCGSRGSRELEFLQTLIPDAGERGAEIRKCEWLAQERSRKPPSRLRQFAAETEKSRMAGEDNNPRGRTDIAEPTDDFDPVHVRHHHIEGDHVRLHTNKGRHEPCAVGKGGDFEAKPGRNFAYY